MHCVRSRLLLYRQSSVVSWSVCLCIVCLLVTLSLAKVAELIEVLFGRLTDVGLRNHVLDGVQGPNSPKTLSLS